MCGGVWIWVYGCECVGVGCECGGVDVGVWVWGGGVGGVESGVIGGFVGVVWVCGCGRWLDGCGGVGMVMVGGCDVVGGCWCVGMGMMSVVW